VHAILGNHDWWDDRAAQHARRGPVIGRRMLEQAGIPVYENDVRKLVKDGRRFWLAGLGDQLAFPGRQGKRARRSFAGVDDLEGTLAKVGDDAPIILLAHEPDIFPRVPDRVALTLSGHTHGGQIRCFGYSPIVPSRFGNRYAYGHVVEGDRHLIVSGGLGCSLLPVRIGVPPEVVVVDVAA
jgi:predicted MPP superfamily phosphohydrolase